MTLFNVFSLLGGLALFLFGMDIMGKALEKQAGGHLQKILSKLTDNPFKGFFLGLCVTAIIQSSSAPTRTPRMGLEKRTKRLVNHASPCRGSTALDMVVMPVIRMAKPMRIVPMPFFFSFLPI